MFRRIPLLMACVVTLAACASVQVKPVIALPNGYYLQPNAIRQTELVKRGGKRVVPGPIAAYAVSGELVVGALGEPSVASRSYTNDLPFHGGPATRYFLLDTRSGQLDTQLDEAAWQSRLQERGAPKPLRIYAPLAWQ